MNELYIVLIRAHTGLGKAARKITGYGYTHIAVCTDRSLTDFVSYSRRYHNYPFEAGFTHEYRDYYAFGHHDSVCIKVFRLTPDAEHYDKVIRYIRRCENDSEETFNLFSMMTMPILHGIRIYKANNCMSFTARVIELSGCVKWTESIIVTASRIWTNFWRSIFTLKAGFADEHLRTMMSIWSPLRSAGFSRVWEGSYVI